MPMRNEHVGDVAVIEEGKPISIVTSRDLTLEVIVPGLAPGDVTVNEIASGPADHGRRIG